MLTVLTAVARGILRRAWRPPQVVTLPVWRYGEPPVLVPASSVRLP